MEKITNPQIKSSVTTRGVIHKINQKGPKSKK